MSNGIFARMHAGDINRIDEVIMGCVLPVRQACSSAP